MKNNVSISVNSGEDEVFIMNVIEENGVNEDMLCNSLGCA